jgi:ubiquinone/menaquinone biosynthesis C-methylase UbiE
VRENLQYCLQAENSQTLLANVWERFSDKNSIDWLEINDVLPYLTSMEADLAMLTWFDVLSIGGSISLSVTNSEYFLELWQKANWDNNHLLNADSDARRAFAGLWGPQENGNPRDDIYQPHQQNIFKSGYNAARLTLLLERAGFCDLQVTSEGAIVKAIGKKTMNRGERQITTQYDQIRPDHLNRYEFACQQIGQLQQDNKILDLACGIGYGTLMLAKNTKAKVTGVDIEQAAISHAKQHFSSENTQFICQDAKLLDIKANTQNVVVSFETIEHVDFDQQLLDIFFRVLKPGGQLICSTPNQEVMPFDPERFAYHLKHYTNTELTELLRNAGFHQIQLYAQHDPVAGDVVAGCDGCFTIAVAVK